VPGDGPQTLGQNGDETASEGGGLFGIRSIEKNFIFRIAGGGTARL
jgi:hypothetical protein